MSIGSRHYIMNKDGSVTPASMEEWSIFFQVNENRKVRNDEINGKTVSTVFLGTDHSFNGKARPLLFETMIFGDDGYSDEEYMDRYSTYEEAVQGHKDAIAFAENRRLKIETRTFHNGNQ